MHPLQPQLISLLLPRAGIARIEQLLLLGAPLGLFLQTQGTPLVALVHGVELAPVGVQACVEPLGLRRRGGRGVGLAAGLVALRDSLERFVQFPRPDLLRRSSAFAR